MPTGHSARWSASKSADSRTGLVTYASTLQRRQASACWPRWLARSSMTTGDDRPGVVGQLRHGGSELLELQVSDAAPNRTTSNGWFRARASRLASRAPASSAAATAVIPQL